MLVRQMTPADVDRAFEIAVMSLGETYLREVFLVFMSGWPAGQLAAVDGLGEVVGFLSGTRISRDKAAIQLFAVDPRRRREGAGGALLEEFRFRAYMEGKRLVQLEVRESNSEAVSFYSRRGFAPVARLDGFYTDGSRALRMVCPVLRDS